MKGTDAFKATIKAYLDDKATTDPLFAKEYQKPDKSLDECVRFVLSEVMKSGCCGMTDDEVYCIVLDYFSEDKVEIQNTANYQVVVNHQVELTESEKAEARQNAIKQLQREQYETMRRPVKKVKPVQTTIESPSLFDF